MDTLRDKHFKNSCIGDIETLGTNEWYDGLVMRTCWCSSAMIIAVCHPVFLFACYHSECFPYVHWPAYFEFCAESISRVDETHIYNSSTNSPFNIKCSHMTMISRELPRQEQALDVPQNTEYINNAIISIITNLSIPGCTGILDLNCC